MVKSLLAGIAVIGLAQGALAQTYSQTTETTTSNPPAAVVPYDASTTRSTDQKTVYPNGAQVDKSTTVTSGNGAIERQLDHRGRAPGSAAALGVSDDLPDPHGHSGADGHHNHDDQLAGLATLKSRPPGPFPVSGGGTGRRLSSRVPAIRPRA